MQAKKIYLGDSVYAAFDGYQVTLTTENGFGPTNTIYLEPNVVDALWKFIKQCEKPQLEPVQELDE